MLQFKPSMLVASSIYLTNSLRKEPVSWTTQLEDHTGYMTDDLETCVGELRSLLSAAPKEPVPAVLPLALTRALALCLCMDYPYCLLVAECRISLFQICSILPLSILARQVSCSFLDSLSIVFFPHRSIKPCTRSLRIGSSTPWRCCPLYSLTTTSIYPENDCHKHLISSRVAATALE